MTQTPNTSTPSDPNFNFHHPYETPYKVQLDLMHEIYKTLKSPNCKLGIFESPTGTGKTLSIICSTMTWLRECKRQNNERTLREKLDNDAQEEDDDDDEPEWVKQSFKEKILKEYLTEAVRFEKHLQEVNKQGASVNFEKKEPARASVRIVHKRRKLNVSSDVNGDENLDDLAPDEYVIADEMQQGKNGISKDVEKLLRSYEQKSANVADRYGNTDNTHATKMNESKMKIFFVSRTHSQLSQFSSQLRMTNFPPSIEKLEKETIKYLPLGSRKQLCINPDVIRLNDAQAINKECQNLQQGQNSKISNGKKEDGQKGCPYMPNAYDEEDVARKQHMNDYVMSQIHDIEEIHKLGENMQLCPYYTIRDDIPIAEIISMPYQLLLHKDTRNVLGLDLKDSVIVIDEAHNLLDTISRIYSASISMEDIRLIRKSLKNYTKKFMLKMSAGNRINISKLNKIVNRICKFMEQEVANGDVKPGKFVERSQIFNDYGDVTDLLNVYELENYLIKSKLAFKLETYMEKTIVVADNGVQKQNYRSRGQPLLFGLKSFLYSLSNPSTSGKFFWDADMKNLTLKYLLLDPSEDFREIVDESKCVILAGGTMEPVTEIEDFLVPYLNKKQMHKFSCDHVIPDENLSVYPIGEYQNQQFIFTYQHRSDERMIIKFGDWLIQFLSKIPQGAVVFFPSYGYIEQVMKLWEKLGVMTRLRDVKHVFVDGRNTSVESTLRDYGNAITDSKKGAVLLSVVGGRMSEGINFSDGLARAVVMVGLPFPDPNSSEMVAKRTYMEQRFPENGVARGRALAETMCMRAVNQAIGRAIRSISDYAVVALVDARYNNPRVKSQLSGWVRRRVVNQKPGDVERFFAAKNSGK